MRYSEARELIIKCIEGDTSIDIYRVAHGLLVDVNEVNFRDDCTFAYCDVTRIIEVRKDLPSATKRRIVAQCLCKFV